MTRGRLFCNGRDFKSGILPVTFPYRWHVDESTGGMVYRESGHS